MTNNLNGLAPSRQDTVEQQRMHLKKLAFSVRKEDNALKPLTDEEKAAFKNRESRVQMGLPATAPAYTLDKLA